jgi:hypothetical protein
MVRALRSHTRRVLATPTWSAQVTADEPWHRALASTYP